VALARTRKARRKKGTVGIEITILDTPAERGTNFVTTVGSQAKSRGVTAPTAAVAAAVAAADFNTAGATAKLKRSQRDVPRINFTVPNDGTHTPVALNAERLAPEIQRRRHAQ